MSSPYTGQPENRRNSGTQQNRTARSVYFEDFEKPDPWLVDEPPAPAEGETYGQGGSGSDENAGWQNSMDAGLPEEGVDWHGHLNPSERVVVRTKQPEPVAKTESMIISAEDEPARIGGITLSRAAKGIVLSEILGPPKGRRYFDRRR